MEEQEMPVTKGYNIELTSFNKIDYKKSPLIDIKNRETPFESIENRGTPPSLLPENKIKAFIIEHKSKIYVIIVFIIFSIFYLIYKNWKFKKIYTIIGIYFGTKQSGYYIINDNNLSSIYTNINCSEIILDEYGLKGLEYGEKAKHHSKTLLEKEKRLYFYNFKKYLIGNEYLDKAIISSDFPKNHNVTLKRVVKEYLDLMKINIKENKIILKKRDKMWVITVPDLWNKNDKNTLKEIVEDIDMDTIEIISESKAALLGSNVIDKNNDLSKNKKYMVINADLYNTDINVYKIMKNQEDKIELITSENYPYGSNLINEEILEIVENSFQKKDIDRAKDNFEIWKITLDDIENKIKTIDDNITEYLEIRTDFNLEYQWTYSFKTYYINKYKNYEIRDYKGKVLIPCQLVKSIINENVLKIISGIEDITNQLKENISQFIVIGELFKSNYVKNLLINKFNNNRIQFLDNYENIVMKGAALYGLKKNNIK